MNLTGDDFMRAMSPIFFIQELCVPLRRFFVSVRAAIQLLAAIHEPRFDDFLLHGFVPTFSLEGAGGLGIG